VQGHYHIPLAFSRWKLSIALARTLCSNHLDHFEYYLDVLQSYFGQYSIIDGNTANIRLKSSRLIRLRDFSRKNKIGELGQAISWIYIMENGYPFINDFRFFCNQANIIIPNRISTPDFIAQSTNLTTDLCIFESKGKELATYASIKSKLKDGLRQCNNGAKLINNNNGYHVTKQISFCAEFSTDKNSFDSSLNFCDPSSENNYQKIDDLPVRIHYASWFYIIGDFQNVENLITNKPIRLNETDYQIREVNGINYWTISFFSKGYYILNILRRNPLFFKSFQRYVDIKIGISDNVVKFLSKNESSLPYNIKPESNENFEIFADGTLIIDFPEEK
jgi:hypothetical protein